LTLLNSVTIGTFVGGESSGIHSFRAKPAAMQGRNASMGGLSRHRTRSADTDAPAMVAPFPWSDRVAGPRRNCDGPTLRHERATPCGHEHFPPAMMNATEGDNVPG
jgi:hypothetical protein